MRPHRQGWIARSLARKRARRRRRLSERAFAAALQTVRPGDVCVDLGAHAGEVSARMLARGAVVHAFEADPVIAERLERRFEADPAFHCVKAAARDRDGEVLLYRASDFDASGERLSESASIFADKVNVTDGATVSVPAIDIVRYLGGLDCDFAILKMDIEGAEVPVLEGLLDAPVISRIAHVFVETHDNRIPSLAAPSSARAGPGRAASAHLHGLGMTCRAVS